MRIGMQARGMDVADHAGATARSEAREDATRTRAIGTAAPVVLVAAGPGIAGGQGNQAQALADNLRAEGIGVRLVPVNPAFPFGLSWIRRIPWLRTVVNEAMYLPSLLALRKAAVVHVFSASYFSFLLGPAPALVAARLFRKPVILNYHSGEARDHLARWGVFVHPWLRLADAIVVPSEYLRGVFAAFGYRARVVPNVIDVSRFRYRERVRIGPRFVSMRNLESHYGVDVVIRAFARIRERCPRATLVVAGDGSQRAALERLAETLGSAGIRFVGRYDPVQAAGLYDAADMFLNASTVDNQPVSVLEAFASGLPVVSSATGDIGAMLQDGQAGVIVEPGSPDALAEAAAALLEDPDRALRLARCAHESLERFSWARVCGDWSAIYGLDGA